MEQVRAFVKWMASFGKSEWSLEDYPLIIRRAKTLKGVGRWVPLPWKAQIINWWFMRGDGETREEAIGRLRERFSAYANRHALPRPGTGAPPAFEFAAQALVTEHAAIVDGILEDVLGVDPQSCLVTDESTLSDFHDGEDNSEILKRISERYGIDVADVAPPTLAGIAARVAQGGRLTMQ